MLREITREKYQVGRKILQNHFKRKLNFFVNKKIGKNARRIGDPDEP